MSFIDYVIADSFLGYESGPNFVFRFFLASSRSFKYHIACLENFPVTLKDRIVSCKMPKFIWCAEIYSQRNFSKKIANSLIIKDATEANKVWTDSLIFAGYPNRSLAKFDKEFVILPYKFSNYSKFISNLQ
jgi:hypothetical protein